MFERILVAVDHSEASASLVDAALALAKANTSRLMLLHVLSPDEEGSPGMPMYPHLSYSPALDETVWEVYQKRWEAFQEENLRILKAYASQAQDEGVEAELTQTPGLPGKVICELAQAWKADMILMGSRGRRGLSELFLGSVSNYVTHHAPCSVLLFKTPSPTQPQELTTEAVPESLPTHTGAAP